MPHRKCIKEINKKSDSSHHRQSDDSSSMDWIEWEWDSMGIGLGSNCWDGWAQATPDVAFVQLTSERSSTNKRTSITSFLHPPSNTPRVENIQMPFEAANLNPVCQQRSQDYKKLCKRNKYKINVDCI